MIADGAKGSYLYDALHRLTNAVGSGLTVNFTYTSFGALLTEDGPWANDTVTYYYKTNHLRSAFSLEQPSASPWTVSYAYDSANRLQTLTDPNGAYTYSYCTPGSLVNKVSLPNGAYVTNVFDSLNRITATYLKNSSHTTLNSHAYQFNAENQRTKHTRTDGSYADYSYDNIGQIKTAVGKEAGGSSRLHEQFGYGYDSAGNLNYRTLRLAWEAPRPRDEAGGFASAWNRCFSASFMARYLRGLSGPRVGMMAPSGRSGGGRWTICSMECGGTKSRFMT